MSFKLKSRDIVSVKLLVTCGDQVLRSFILQSTSPIEARSHSVNKYNVLVTLGDLDDLDDLNGTYSLKLDVFREPRDHDDWMRSTTSKLEFSEVIDLHIIDIESQWWIIDRKDQEMLEQAFEDMEMFKAFIERIISMRKAGKF